MKDDKVIDLQQVKNDRGEHDLEQTIETLRQRVRELMAINGTHKELMGKLIVENEELKKDNKALAKQIDDYFNAR
jgi:regulator of replication initiation timing